jgi:hypothetical protein
MSVREISDCQMDERGDEASIPTMGVRGDKWEADIHYDSHALKKETMLLAPVTSRTDR